MSASVLQPVLLVAVGGALGSMARYGMNLAVVALLGSQFPYGTFAINVIGSFVIGLVSGMTEVAWIRQLVMVGMLGGFTTFSSFSLESVNLVQKSRPLAASIYILGSVGLCLLGTLLGLVLARVLVAQRPA